MTKEEYAAALNDIIKEQDALDKKRGELIGSYIEENRRFKSGDKVGVTVNHFIRGNETKVVFIFGCGVRNDGEIQYQFNKTKKDGTQSTYREFFFDTIKSIELIEAAVTTN